MSNAADVRRRWRGMLCLAIAAGLLIWGQTVLQPLLKGVPFLLYWLACFVFTLAAIVIALLDIRAVRRRVRDEHRELIARALRDLEQPQDHDSKPGE
jgi:membrane protein implicated in regulation of membrane protease activity